ncbi:hypothetical protein BPAE_0117g00190 [Botrytis paeoniae]|uniref:Uncharacterized protein n=1 Tax=Botrytis paeoniae TaxID=278948 RepID=A0A4Z1FGD3_9HELO|nr:hypothetical protein BPAE_0117g00190 [Botrytis paeoniae]
MVSWSFLAFIFVPGRLSQMYVGKVPSTWDPLLEAGIKGLRLIHYLSVMGFDITFASFCTDSALSVRLTSVLATRSDV